MKLERKINLGGFESMGFESSDHITVQECARDLVQQMQPMTGKYPILAGKIDELKKAYSV